MPRKLLVLSYAGFLGLVLAIGAMQLLDPVTPTLPAFGLTLTAIAPLIFLAWARRAPAGRRQHPVMVSVVMGLSLVCIMIGIQRFGQQHQWLLILALLALVGWMAYQRWVWRATSATDNKSS